MALLYMFRLAAQSILHEKWINLLSVLVVAACFAIISIVLFSVYNVEMATRKLTEEFSIMLYLKEDISPEESKNVIDMLKKDSAIKTVRYISKDEAMKELASALKDTAYVLEGFDKNPLPDSVEIRLDEKAVAPESVKILADRLRKINGVNEVEYGEKFLSSIYSIRKGVRTLGTVFTIIMSAGIIFICFSTVKILFHRKGKEIEIYKLLGAKRGFIRAPFIIEGAVVGLSGSLLALIGILSLYYMLMRFSLEIPLFQSLIFPANIFLFLPLAGLLLGITGATIAIGRIRY